MIPDGRGSKMLPIQAILANLGTSNSYFVDRPGARLRSSVGFLRFVSFVSMIRISLPTKS